VTSAPRTTIALTIGDPNGIGPEIAVKAAAVLANGAGLRVILVGDPSVIGFYVNREAPTLRVREHIGSGKPDSHFIDIMPVETAAATSFRPGRIDAAAGKATVSYVEAAIALVRSGAASAIVGCPHNETAVNAAGIPFSGYPSLLARLTGVPEDRVFLMLVAGRLRIIHATLHERLQSALARLTVDLVQSAAIACRDALVALGVENPRIGLFGINPHAGENGLFGDDDEQITAPATAHLREAGLQVEGPMGADVMLARDDIDAFVAMYHDQGHIPIKLVAGRKSSALSVGAGLIFSGVGHGSAFDIAGQGRADPEAALRTLRLIAGFASGSSSKLGSAA
jgi:4-hydroxy-L-threonine phosphate dehydrogenase PdxA